MARIMKLLATIAALFLSLTLMTVTLVLFIPADWMDVSRVRHFLCQPVFLLTCLLALIPVYLFTIVFEYRPFGVEWFDLLDICSLTGFLVIALGVLTLGFEMPALAVIRKSLPHLFLFSLSLPVLLGAAGLGIFVTGSLIRAEYR